MPKGTSTDATCPVVEEGVVCGLHADHNGMCKKHWTRFTRHGDPTFRKILWGDAEGRFFQKVNKNGPIAKNNPELGRCWLWIGSRNKSGYGRFGVGSDKVMLAHRWAYEHWIGSIPTRKPLDHFACDNGAGGCCNPYHVRPVTHRESVLRSNSMAARWAARTHCKNGHPFDEENTVIYSRGSRVCRTCRLEKRRTGKRPWTYGKTGPKPRMNPRKQD